MPNTTLEQTISALEELATTPAAPVIQPFLLTMLQRPEQDEFGAPYHPFNKIKVGDVLVSIQGGRVFSNSSPQHDYYDIRSYTILEFIVMGGKLPFDWEWICHNCREAIRYESAEKFINDLAAFKNQSPVILNF